MSRFNLTKHLSTRVLPETHKRFMTKAEKIGKPSDVLRSLVEAFIKDSAKPKISKGTSK